VTTTTTPLPVTSKPSWGKLGEFDYERWEDGAGSWAVHHTATGTLLAFRRSPDDCLRYIGSGDARADLELIQAHQRGEHEAGRVQLCGRC
jgi:hypothetical protein